MRFEATPYGTPLLKDFMLTTKLYTTRCLAQAMIFSYFLLWMFDIHASPQSITAQSIQTIYSNAVSSPIRTQEDKFSDATRRPLEFLQFTKIQPGMLVLDISAGRGNTAQLLALVVGDNGVVWAQTDKEQPALIKRLMDHPQSNIIPVIRTFEDPTPDNAPKLDLITIIMNYHDIVNKSIDRTQLNKKIFNALKSGGHLIVIDHSAKSNSGISETKTLHRIDKNIVINEFLESGLRLEEESNFLHNSLDPRDQAFFKMTIPSDKFSLRFVKP